MPDEAKEPKKLQPQIEILRPGKDEMNLVEYPFASLRREDGSDSVIKIEWEMQHPLYNRTVKALWRVAGDPVWGLPTVSDERVYLVLMELSREAGFADSVVNFSCYDLLRRLAWSDNQKHYNLLRDTFERLKSVNIITRNAFWSHKNKSFVNTGFSLIEFYELVAEKPGRKKADDVRAPNSYFKWNDVMFSSMQAGFLKTVDLDLALSLRSSIAVRLYRYLDKKAFDGRAHFEIELAVLCERHLGMTPNPYPSKLKERLKTAHDELIARDFLKAVEYEPMVSKKGEKIRYVFARPQHSPALPETDLSLSADATPGEGTRRPSVGTAVFGTLATPVIGMMPEDLQPSLFNSPQLPAPEASAPEAPALEGADLQPEAPVVPEGDVSEEAELMRRMLQIKVSPEVARELMRQASGAALRLQLDCLDARQPRDRAAVFVKAVREGWDAPAKYLEALAGAGKGQERAQTIREAHQDAQAARAAQKAAEHELEAQAREEAKSLDAFWDGLDEATRGEIESQAHERLGVLGRSGRAHAAQDAMRRTLLRERMGKAQA